MRDDRERLEDILEALERIEKYAVRGQAAPVAARVPVDFSTRTPRQTDRICAALMRVVMLPAP